MIMDDGTYLVKQTSKEATNELLNFLKDYGFTKRFLAYNESDYLIVDVIQRTITNMSNDACEALSFYNRHFDLFFYDSVNHDSRSNNVHKKLYHDDVLTYEGNTICDNPYGLGTSFFSNGNKYQEGIFSFNGIIKGKEYYPNGNLRFEGIYDVCFYGSNYPIYGNYYDEDGHLIFSGRFEVNPVDNGCPEIENPKDYEVLQKNAPKIKYFHAMTID